MSVAFLNDTTVTNFINDTKIFDDCVKESFKKLDRDNDGFLNKNELRNGFGSQPLELELMDPVDDLCEVVCHKFNVEKSGGIDENEFKSVVRDILLAMALGIGNFPLQVALQQDSFLMKAVELEKAKEQK
ncbi:calcium-binding EF hand family protein [Cucumis melo var. makuwa]|uniref:Calcium-binding EF hand family protein n=1 Tax=Cucumis melo var. makuwa TaxID=1194695 RepID=A0A5D3B8A7_CUCMM|nr:calcium-binding EF hand family protein [Cucumis melo var. makuwa]